MEIVFKDQKLGLIETDEAEKTRLPIAVIISCRKKLVLLRAMSDERDLRNWKGLQYEKLKGDKKGLKSIRINDQWRVVFDLDNNRNPPRITILKIEDYH